MKIATYALLVKNLDLDKEKLTSELVEIGFEKKYQKIGLMKAYRIDGTEISNNANISEFSDQYQLLGKFCSVAFGGNEIILHHKFGILTSEITYNLENILNQILRVVHVLKNCSKFESNDFELILLICGIGSKNPKDVLRKWMNTLDNVPDDNISDEYLDSESMEFPGKINKRCTKKIIMVRNNEYVIEMRFESKDLEKLCDDFKNSEKITNDVILELENEN